jgi:hypothetical protein
VSDQTPAASHSVGASHLSLVTLELRGQSRNSLLQLAALPLDRHEAGVCSQQLLSDRVDLRGREGGASVMLSGYSDATVKLITGLFRELETDASTGRAEGLRRSMLALIDPGGDNSHPANWAPFVVVGEGAH